MDANVDAVRQVTADVEDRPTALYPLGGGYVAAGNTFDTSLIELAGAERAARRHVVPLSSPTRSSFGSTRTCSP